jgi:hypothetical protein
MNYETEQSVILGRRGSLRATGPTTCHRYMVRGLGPLRVSCQVLGEVQGVFLSGFAGGIPSSPTASPIVRSLVKRALHGMSGDKVFPVVGTGFVAMAAHSPRKARRVLRHLKQGSKGQQSLEPNIAGCSVAYVSLAPGGRHRWLRGPATLNATRRQIFSGLILFLSHLGSWACRGGHGFDARNGIGSRSECGQADVRGLALSA